MNRPVWGKVGIVALLLIAIVAVAGLKESSDTSGASTVRSTQAAPTRPVATGLPRLLDLGSTSCIPCKMMAPILDELKKTYAGKLQVDFIDVWQNKGAGEQYGIEAIPTQIIFDASGKELYRHTGFYSKEDILAKLKELGVKL
jgi:thioredoxin 1